MILLKYRHWNNEISLRIEAATKTSIYKENFSYSTVLNNSQASQNLAGSSYILVPPFPVKTPMQVQQKDQTKGFTNSYFFSKAVATSTFLRSIFFSKCSLFSFSFVMRISSLCIAYKKMKQTMPR